MVLSCFTVAALVTVPVMSQGREARLSGAQMRSIAIVAVRAKEPAALRLPKFELLREDNHAGYAWFEAVADTQGSVHQGFVVVDPRTGDAWDGVTECGDITSPELGRLQRKLRSEIGLSHGAYSKVRRRGPLCDQPAIR